MGLFLGLLIFVTFAAIFTALALVTYQGRWWPALFMFCLFIMFAGIIVLLAADVTVSSVDIASIVKPAAALGDITQLAPIFIILLVLAFCGLAIVMTAGSISLATRGSNFGTVGMLLITFVALGIVIFPLFYIWFRVFLVASIVLTMGILSGSTFSALRAALANPSPPFLPRHYGSQTFSHIYYYIAAIAFISASGQCQSNLALSELLGAGVLAASCATIGIVVESSQWS
jgi:hypothetical protein